MDVLPYITPHIMAVPQKQTLEQEIKLKMGRTFALPHLPGHSFPPRVLTSTYYDTDDFRLGQHGITLRYRTEARTGVWQLKLPRENGRLELEFRGNRDDPPDEITKLLFAHLRGQPLKPIARLRTRRSGIHVQGSDGPVADVVMDQVTAWDAHKAIGHFHELEIERTGGSDKEFRRLEQVLREAGAEDGDTRPKVFQALGLALPAPEPPLSPDSPPLEHLKALLHAQVKQILMHDPGTRLGKDPEDLHQMRVAVRRLRAFLRAARPMLDPDWDETLRTDVGWLGKTLGPMRDLDVLFAHLRGECANLPLPERRVFERMLRRLETQRSDTHAVLVQELESDTYLALLERIETAAQAPIVKDSTVCLADLARSEFKKLRRCMREWSEHISDKTLHRIRIRGKRARYTAELAKAAVGKPANRFIRRMKTFQDWLGEHQDALVAEQWLRTLLPQASDPSTAFTIGRLIERQCERRRTVRAGFCKVWAKVRKRGQQAWG